MNTSHNARWGLAGRTLLVGAVVVAAALAGGCSDGLSGSSWTHGSPGAPGAPAGSAPADTSPPPASDLPSQSAEPPATTPASQDWVISTSGIGPYQVGDPFQPTPGCGINGLKSVTGDPHGAVLLYDHFWEQRGAGSGPLITRLQLSAVAGQKPLPARTAEGIGLGSTRAEVMAAYPQAIVLKNMDVDGLAVYFGEVSIIFTFRDFRASGHPDNYPDSYTESPSDPVVIVNVGGLTPIGSCG